MKENLEELEETVNENSYKVLLKSWLKIAGATILVGVISLVIGFGLGSSNSVQLPSFVFNSNNPNIVNSVSSILGPSVSAIGLVLGFSPRNNIFLS